MASRITTGKSSEEAQRQEEEAQRRAKLAQIISQLINNVIPMVATQIAESVTVGLNAAQGQIGRRENGERNALGGNMNEPFTSYHPKESYGTEGFDGLPIWF